MDWMEFVAAWVVFFLTHSLPIRPPLRPLLQGLLGKRGFMIAYSMLSLGTLGWLISAAGRAPYLPLWNWAPWQSYVPLAVMLPVCLIFALAVGRPNPFSFCGAHNDRFDPAQAGIVRVTRHPLLAALTLWAAAHIVPNGDLAHVLLFGVFFVFAALGGRLVDKRRRREMGAGWQSLYSAVMAPPKTAKPASWPATLVRLFVGSTLFVSLIWLHPLLFGVDPLV